MLFNITGQVYISIILLSWRNKGFSNKKRWSLSLWDLSYKNVERSYSTWKEEKQSQNFEKDKIAWSQGLMPSTVWSLSSDSRSWILNWKLPLSTLYIATKQNRKKGNQYI